jgi:hypothetical protein
VILWVRDISVRKGMRSGSWEGVRRVGIQLILLSGGRGGRQSSQLKHHDMVVALVRRRARVSGLVSHGMPMPRLDGVG